MKRARASMALGVMVLVAGSLAGAAASAEVPLPWPTLADAAQTASDRLGFRCATGEEGVKMRFRGDQASGDTYGYFSVVGDHWIMVRYPHDQTGNPDHVWFGATPAVGTPTLTVHRDEPFDPVRHASPCSEWLLGPAAGARPDGPR